MRSFGISELKSLCGNDVGAVMVVLLAMAMAAKAKAMAMVA